MLTGISGSKTWRFKYHLNGKREKVTIGAYPAFTIKQARDRHEELRALVQAAITETGAAAPSDMGKVMKVVMPKVAGRAPNDAISSAVKELLTK